MQVANHHGGPVVEMSYCKLIIYFTYSLIKLNVGSLFKCLKNTFYYNEILDKFSFYNFMFRKHLTLCKNIDDYHEGRHAFLFQDYPTQHPATNLSLKVISYYCIYNLNKTVHHMIENSHSILH